MYVFVRMNWALYVKKKKKRSFNWHKLNRIKKKHTHIIFRIALFMYKLTMLVFSTHTCVILCLVSSARMYAKSCKCSCFVYLSYYTKFILISSHLADPSTNTHIYTLPIYIIRLYAYVWIIFLYLMNNNKRFNNFHVSPH